MMIKALVIHFDDDDDQEHHARAGIYLKNEEGGVRKILEIFHRSHKGLWSTKGGDEGRRKS